MTLFFTNKRQYISVESNSFQSLNFKLISSITHTVIYLYSSFKILHNVLVIFLQQIKIIIYFLETRMAFPDTSKHCLQPIFN